MGGIITAGKQDAEKWTYDDLIFIRAQFLIYTSVFKWQQGREKGTKRRVSGCEHGRGCPHGANETVQEGHCKKGKG